MEFMNIELKWIDNVFFEVFDLKNALVFYEK